MRVWIMSLLWLACPLRSDTPRATISLPELSHRPPAAALKDYGESARAWKNGDIGAAILRLERGLLLDPKNIAAHNDLGILYLDLKQPGKALEEFTQMLEIAPSSAAGHRNLSYALLALKRFPAAEAAARQALRLDGSNGTAHLLLGFALVGQQKYNAEALRSLRIAAEQFNEALLALADVLVRLGQPAEARQQVERYMQSPKPEQKELGEILLRMLTLQ